MEETTKESHLAEAADDRGGHAGEEDKGVVDGEEHDFPLEMKILRLVVSAEEKELKLPHRRELRLSMLRS